MEEEKMADSSESRQHSASSVTDWFLSISLTSWLVAAFVILLLLWIWQSNKKFTVFSKMGVPYVKPLPIIGNNLSFIKGGFLEPFQKYAKEYGKVYGVVFSSVGPSLVVTDLDMLKEILIKQFQHFPNRSNAPQMNYKPWKDTLTQLKGDDWKHVRSTLSPTFSSGKIKRMMPAIQRVSVDLKDYLSGVASTGEMIELKDMCGRFSMDVIGAVAFGMDVASIHNPDNAFVRHANVMMNPNKLTLALFMMLPKLMGKLNKWGMLSGFKDALDFLLNVIDQALKERQTDMQKYHDFLQLLVESEMEGNSGGAVDAEINFKDQLNTSEKWNRKGLTKDEMRSNAFIFLLAGYETVSTTVAFSLFCLANNPECLKKAQAEVDSKLGQKQVTYDLANDLTYLEMCIAEALRLYPPGFMLTRCAVDDVDVCGMRIPKDMHILIPTIVVHMDPALWPQPEQFDPLRHTSEARAERHPYSYMPFGQGPRNCIGMRLAQLTVRMAVATVLQHFTPVACEKTVYPPKLSKFRMRAVDQLWIKFQKRE